MTKELLLKRLEQYTLFLKTVGCTPQRSTSVFNTRSLDHICWMFEEIPKFLEENRIEKAFRWFGFVQGVLWVERIYSLEALKDHNRSPESIEEN